VRACVRACVYVCVCVCDDLHECMCVCLCVCVCVCVSVSVSRGSNVRVGACRCVEKRVHVCLGADACVRIIQIYMRV